MNIDLKTRLERFSIPAFTILFLGAQFLARLKSTAESAEKRCSHFGSTNRSPTAGSKLSIKQIKVINK